MKEREYIHYGSPKFDKIKFCPVRNRNDFIGKPFGGLWASRKDAKRGWKWWCKSNNFCTNLLKKRNSFTFTLDKNANVFTITSVEDLKKLPEIENKTHCLSNYEIDFEKCMEQGIDAIELHYFESDDVTYNWDSLYYKLYGWDCDSIIIMNPDIINQTKEEF